MVDRNTIEVLDFGQRAHSFDDTEPDEQLPPLASTTQLSGINYKVSSNRLGAIQLCFADGSQTKLHEGHKATNRPL